MRFCLHNICKNLCEILCEILSRFIELNLRFISSNYFRVNQYDGQKVIEMGFGSTDFGAGNANALKVATASMMPNAQCKQTYGNELTDRDSCTYSQSRNDTCQVS